MDEDREVSRLWRVYRTIHEMVSHRGYMVSKAELEMSLEDFRQTYTKGGIIDRQGLTFLVQHSSSADDQLLVFFTEDDSDLRANDITVHYERHSHLQKSLTPSANKVVQEMAPKYQLELFQESELLVNITQHTLVPVHEVLSVEEKRPFLPDIV
ncbi:hypothetical protein BASA81_011437 [Batrachochytrium salamandrivorans]|nr:hypothetical protein BASA81_011437 [Batrachochytrium salamandrivorans]